MIQMLIEGYNGDKTSQEEWIKYTMNTICYIYKSKSKYNKSQSELFVVHNKDATPPSSGAPSAARM